ncbi:parallel beta-helix repeat [Methanobacterium lacus]|uniref:Parallel beta-helix repeat n=1 Tax=Methanobacterium lacus (strain AL-21) TaxID=877455 RepID=F0TBK8_METLA|nr:right-handed parallel beta-helix repeat-containing protein [Methanobacterium lacus]ADZ09085.1 parallel beta-helix repeat [Methanobacterium lacus]
MIKKIIICTLFLVFCFTFIQSTEAANVTVLPGQSIQTAVNNAASGDNINVYDDNNNPYTYKESIAVNKKVNIKAHGNVNVEAINPNSAVFTVNPKGAGTSIQNFTLSKSSYCIVINNANNCIISGNKINEASLVGIQFYGPMNNSKVIGNIITGVNPAVGNGISFEYGFCTFNTISGNVIHNFLNGILFNYNSENNLVSNNKVLSTGLTGVGIYSTADSRLMTIIGNTVTGAEDGIAIQQFHMDIPSGYIINGNTLTGNKNGFWLRISNSTISNNIVAQNIVSGFDITGRYNKIINNIISYNGNSGITLAGFSSKDFNVVSNNVINYNVAGVSSASNYTTFSNNIMSFNTFHALISVGNHVTISRNTMKNNVGSGIFVIGTYCTIVHNILQYNIIGMTLQKSTNADHNVISFNELTSNGNGINSASPYSTFNNNLIKYNTETGLIITGSGCYITKNAMLSNHVAGLTITSTGNTVISNSFANNLFGASFSSYKAAKFNLNSLIGNYYQVYSPDTSGAINALNNWWGSSGVPKRIYGLFNFNPWIVLRLNSNYNKIIVGSTSKIVLNLRYNNKGVYTSPLYGGKYIIDGIIVGFSSDSLGILNPVVSTTKNGLSSTTFTARHTGTSTIRATVNSQSISTSIKIYPKLAVTSTSPVKNAFRVPLNTVIKITYNVPIKLGSKSLISLTNKWGNKLFDVYISGSTLYIKPRTILARATQYTVILHTNSVRALSGSSGSSLFGYAFTTTK